MIAFAGSVTEEAIKCNEKGIDAFFSILPGVCSLDEAMNTETAQKKYAECGGAGVPVDFGFI